MDELSVPYLCSNPLNQLKYLHIFNAEVLRRPSICEMLVIRLLIGQLTAVLFSHWLTLTPLIS